MWVCVINIAKFRKEIIIPLKVFHKDWIKERKRQKPEIEIVFLSLSFLAIQNLLFSQILLTHTTTLILSHGAQWRQSAAKVRFVKKI